MSFKSCCDRTLVAVWAGLIAAQRALERLSSLSRLAAGERKTRRARAAIASH